VPGVGSGRPGRRCGFVCSWARSPPWLPRCSRGCALTLAALAPGHPQVLRLHRCLGTIASVWVAVLALLSEVEARREQRSQLFRLILWIGALLIELTGHFGGILAQGMTSSTGESVLLFMTPSQVLCQPLPRPRVLFLGGGGPARLDSKNCLLTSRALADGGGKEAGWVALLGTTRFPHLSEYCLFYPMDRPIFDHGAQLHGSA
jgi:hypothetical protein